MAELDPSLLEANEDHLVLLQRHFMKAMQLREAGDESGAAKVLEEILREEPRLAEPRLELAHIHLLHDRFDEAHEHAKLAVSTLRAGGQWTQDVEPSALLSFAVNLLGETVARRLEEGDLFLTDRASFTRLWNEASAHFDEAARLDGCNEDALRNRTRFAPLLLDDA